MTESRIAGEEVKANRAERKDEERDFPSPDFPFVSVFSPEAVSISSVRFCGLRSTRNAPAQRIPFPDISASLPSALKKRIRASCPRVSGFITTIRPSAPAPVWRSRILRAKGASAEGRSGASATSQSFPIPWYLVKGSCLVIFENEPEPWCAAGQPVVRTGP